jgi:hypothetical protein
VIPIHLVNLLLGTGVVRNGRGSTMIPFIGPIISGIFGVGKQYLSNKAEKAQAKHEREVTIIKGDQKWDEIQAKNSGESWKDEYLTVILTSPFVAMFLAAVLDEPEMVMRISDAFMVLKSDVPDEYWMLLSVVVAASFGMKKVVDVIKGIRGGK